MTRLAVDVRALADKELTGVGTYELGLLEALVSLQPDMSLRFWTSGAVPSDKTHISKLLSRPQDDHLQFFQSNKYFNLSAALGSAGTQLYRQLAADRHFFPHPNFLLLPVPQRYAVTVHDLSFMHQPSWYDLKGRIWHRALRLGEVLTSAASIIAVSQSTAEQIQHYFPHIPCSKISVIYHGIDAEPLTREQAEQAVAELTVPPHFILSLGTVEPRKNIASVIAAYRLWRQKYPEIKLVIAGKYGWSVDIANLNHQEREGIIWLRYVTVAQKKALYRLARLFVWPSFYEGFGFPPLEALAQGTPVVTSYTTAMPELLHEQAQYVNPYNYAELAQVIMQLLESPRPSGLGSDLAERFRWQTAAEKTLRVLQQL
jgi:glycosyltransferase involved in cell wall biosynthesis